MTGEEYTTSEEGFLIGFLEKVTCERTLLEEESTAQCLGQKEARRGMVQQQNELGSFREGKNTASWLEWREGKRYKLR